jgi:hypothetical protein
MASLNEEGTMVVMVLLYKQKQAKLSFGDAISRIIPRTNNFSSNIILKAILLEVMIP